ncbi:MAG: hypothetical protein AAB257_07145 [Nitrospinota bacterium]
MEGRSGTLWEGRYKSSPIKAGEEVSKRTGKRIEFRGQGRPKSREK